MIDINNPDSIKDEINSLNDAQRINDAKMTLSEWNAYIAMQPYTLENKGVNQTLTELKLFAKDIFCAMVSNPDLNHGNDMDTVSDKSIMAATILLKKLNQKP
jgi:hypothetical protein